MPSRITMSCTKSFDLYHQDYIPHVTRFLLADCFYEAVVLRPALMLVTSSCCGCCHILFSKIVHRLKGQTKQKYSLQKKSTERCKAFIFYSISFDFQLIARLPYVWVHCSLGYFEIFKFPRRIHTLQKHSNHLH